MVIVTKINFLFQKPHKLILRSNFQLLAYLEGLFPFLKIIVYYLMIRADESIYGGKFSLLVCGLLIHLDIRPVIIERNCYQAVNGAK